MQEKCYALWFDRFVVSGFYPRTLRTLSSAVLLLTCGIGVSFGQTTDELPGRLIGATATVTEMASGLPFLARVDTGATSCSIHCESLEIKDAAADPKENIGKPARFLVKNHDGSESWVETKIADHVKVRTSNKQDERYKVPLKLRVDDVEKKVLVTLNDREKMRYPLLLGRNFLANDFVVHITLDPKE